MRVSNTVLTDPELHIDGSEWSGFDLSWYFAKDGFNDKEVEQIKELKDSYSFKRGVTVGEDSTSTKAEVRESEVFWVNQNKQSDWIYNRISWHINKANHNKWKFNIDSMEQIQYTKYKGSDVLEIEDKVGIRSHRDAKKQAGHYNWHTDTRSGSIGKCRKISTVVQLSDAKEYEGGDFLTWDHKGEIYHGKGKGSIIIFPSFNLHKVLPITSGIRESLVVWCHGPLFQ